MGRVIIQEETTKFPYELIGREAGICWGADVSNKDKNIKRGHECLKAQHGRTLEFPQIYMVLDGYSARVIREFYTHIGGAPTRLQASTRYINYDNFEYITPPNIEKDEKAKHIYNSCMYRIMESVKELENLNIVKEDSANLLPLGMTTKVVCRTNLRNLIDMSHQRMCNRAYWEFRQMFSDIKKALSDYSPEWAELISGYFEPKCSYLGFCPETYSCGYYKSKSI